MSLSPQWFCQFNCGPFHLWRYTWGNSHLLLNLSFKADKSSQWPIINSSETRAAWHNSGESQAESTKSDYLSNLPSSPVILSNPPTTSNWAFQSSSIWNTFLYGIGYLLSCWNLGRDIELFCSDSAIIIKKASFKKSIITKVDLVFVENNFFFVLK